MADDSSIQIVVQGYRTFIPNQGDSTCPVVEKGLTGDGPISWSFPFTPYTDRLPGRHAHVALIDSVGEVQTGRIVLRDPPDTDCNGLCTLTARGYNESLADQKFGVSTQFGPVWEQQVIGPLNQNVFGEVGAGTSLAETAAAAVSYAVAQLGASVSVGDVTGDIVLGNSEDFLGRTAIDAVAAMSAQSGGLATPYVWSVKRGVFRHLPLDTGARYQVTIGDGVIFAPKDDASKLYNRVIVLWGKGQAVTYPSVVSYDQIPTIVDLVVNAGTEIHDLPSAQRLAEGLYGRLQTLELGWAGQLTVVGDAPILERGVGLFPWRVDAQAMMRMDQLDAWNRWGARIPDKLLITHARWDGPSNVTTFDLGEMRDPSKLTTTVIRKTVAGASSRSIWGGIEVNLSEPLRDNDKAPQMGPGAITDPVDLQDSHSNPTPNPIDHGLVAVATDHGTIHPDVQPPMPPATMIGLTNWDTASVPFRDSPVPVFPMQVDGWEMHANVAATITVNLRRLSDDAVVCQVQLVGEQNHTATLTPASNPNLKIIANDGIVPEITVADTNTAIKWVTIWLRQSRLYPGYKGGVAGAAVRGL